MPTAKLWLSLLRKMTRSCLHDVLPYMFMSAFVMIVTYFVTKSIEGIYLLLFAKIAIAASMYIFLAYIMRCEELFETMAFLFSRKK